MNQKMKTLKLKSQKPKTRKLDFRLDEDLANHLKRLANKFGVSEAEVMRRAIVHFLSSLKQKDYPYSGLTKDEMLAHIHTAWLSCSDRDPNQKVHYMSFIREMGLV